MAQSYVKYMYNVDDFPITKKDTTCNKQNKQQLDIKWPQIDGVQGFIGPCNN